MSRLGARPGGPTHVVFTDLREELVVYVNGRPYLRRELEMPSAALHHAGISQLSPSDLKRSAVALPSTAIDSLYCRGSCGQAGRIGEKAAE